MYETMQLFQNYAQFDQIEIYQMIREKARLFREFELNDEILCFFESSFPVFSSKVYSKIFFFYCSGPLFVGNATLEILQYQFISLV